MAQLSVEIVGETKKLEKALDKAGKELKGLENTTKGFSTKFNKSTASASKGFNKLNKSAISGSSAMTAFSRTVQDAPFGIMGVSNNITNLTEQFGYLKNKTGSAGGALKAMLRDLKGFGGISLAISVATSLMLVFGDKIKKATKSSNKLSKAIKKTSESMGVEINKLSALKDALIDENTEKSTKLKIIAKLKKDYPKYFGFLNSEKVNVTKVTDAYKLQKRAIIGLGITKALEAQKAPEYAKLAELELKKASELLTAADKIFLTSGALTFDQISKFTSDLAKQSKDRQIKEIEKNIAEIDKAAERIKSKFNISVDDVLGFEDSNNDEIKEKVTALFSELNPIVSNGMQGFNKVITFEQLKMLETLGKFNPLIASAVEGIKKSMSFEGLQLFPITEFDLQAEAFKARLQRFNEDISVVIEGSLKNTFAGIGQAIGEAMANGGNLMSGLGKALLSNVGGLLTQLGKMAIGVGIGIKAIKAALQTLNPVAAIGAGVALVALGSAFSAGASKLGGSNSSGGGSANGGAERYSPSSSNSSSISSSGGGLQNVVFEIQGTKLVGVLSNTLARNRSLGGSLGIG